MFVRFGERRRVVASAPSYAALDFASADATGTDEFGGPLGELRSSGARVRSVTARRDGWVTLDDQELRALRPGDQVFVRREVAGPVWDWAVSFLIRVATFTKRDKRPSVVNHVATVLRPVTWASVDPASGELGPPRVIDYEIAEALGRGGFQVRLLIESYGDPRLYSIAVASHAGASQEHREKIVAACEHLLGKRYGYLKIGAHVLDYVLTQAWNALGGRGDAFLVRRLCRMERYPMCSWSSLYAYQKAGLPFETDLASGSPDDLWDECRRRSMSTWFWPYCSPSLKGDLYGDDFGGAYYSARLRAAVRGTP